jgi:quercetin dioxygenase-like cupin family protein
MHSLHLSLSRLFCILAALALGVTARANPGEATAVNAGYSAQVAVARLLKTQVDAAGRPLVYPTDGQAEITAVLVEMQPGAETGWHKHPLPCVGYILEGELHVTLKDGRVNVFKAGQAIAEVVDLEHNGVNPGPGVARLVMFVIGTEGKAFTVKTPAPSSDPAPAAAE